MTTQLYAIYNTTTGKINKLGLYDITVSTSLVALEMSIESGELYISVPSDTTFEQHYILSSSIATRPSLDTICSLTNSGSVWSANGIDTILYGSSLPNPTTYSIYSDNQEFTPISGNITDGSLSLTTITAANYTIELKAFPYLDKTITITAV